ncbi:TIGR03086 family protein [Mycobacterium sp. 852002-51971_SCH5477799-a]|uniref:TIGR03086 family metal-binding protein n=1 Tax=Mycobacterium sp. 852002-51971_SCH5477799-a TaxID=1834106 RepID=UPI0007FE93A1|nr:TIGR03086 family metal-binding protein [Mycobacterium sp. 852002-51971_SCH5477799-a]OBF61774.1 TIGR03086 family protein [Mycobacterium sp. 852002-51971_SCH5477799-a]
MYMINTLRAHHREAVLATIDLVERVSTSDLERPTPCSDWNLLELLAHMTAQHRGFAAAAYGAGADPAVWEASAVIDAVAADPAGSYAAAACELLSVIAEDETLAVPFELPDFGEGAVFPFEQAIGFHFIDYVVHGWDVASALGIPFKLPDNVIDAALVLGLQVPGGDYRTGASAPFGPALDQAPEGNGFDRLLRHLGRSPAWSAPDKQPA